MPDPLTTRDVLRYATMNGAKSLRFDGKIGSLTPGKEADIIILDATALNVAPLNQVPGAVVSLMDRTNVETVIVAGKVRKWKGRLLDVDLKNLRRQLEASRDHGSSPLRASSRTCSAATDELRGRWSCRSCGIGGPGSRPEAATTALCQEGWYRTSCQSQEGQSGGQVFTFAGRGRLLDLLNSPSSSRRPIYLD